MDGAHTHSPIDEALDAADVGDSGRLDELLKHGIDADATNSWGQSLGSISALNGHVETTTRLLAAGADPVEPFRCAATNGHNAVLVLFGAYLDAIPKHTLDDCLPWAAGSGFHDVVRTLLEFGADVNAVTNRGYDATAYAARGIRDRDQARAMLRTLAGAGADFAHSTQEAIMLYQGDPLRDTARQAVANGADDEPDSGRA